MTWSAIELAKFLTFVEQKTSIDGGTRSSVTYTYLDYR